ncbi:MAG: bifunctional folylpolyglutamate synthase/dihydrofolate synthase [Candidatus Margulisbacteria bacterium]|nr:bifunctional folylpolyglutamate synthase/dihydrofolate synthase [Candidatus Margulisiibacteriota bacterium]
MNYVRFLSSLERFGINLGLERINFLLDQLGNPQNKFKSIHIAGTNGKGSSAAMTASILKEAGYKVGLYTSPHLFDFTERIKINSKDISRKEFSEGIKQIKKILTTKQSNHPTTFEVLTALAFWYFAKKKVDYAVVEVGMGGRLDATNVLLPEVSIITNIDYEHIEILGKSLAKIAKEKAGIIKPGVPVVTAERKKEVLAVIKRVCKEKSAKLKVESRAKNIGKKNLLGVYQGLNAACAVSAINLAGIKVGKAAIKKGLAKTKWPGRFQIVSKRPLVIVDGAHNPAGAKNLRVTIEEMFKQKFNIIFGCQQDKDYQKILAELKSIASQIILTRSSHKSAQKIKLLASYLKKQDIVIKTAASPRKAINVWDGKAPLLVTGSLFLLADVLKKLDGFERA